MSNIIYLLSLTCAAIGLFFLFAELFGAPTQREEKALTKLLAPAKVKKDTYEAVIDAIATRIAPLLPFSKRQLQRTEATLKAVHLEISPRIYLARNIVKSALLFLVCLLCGFVVKPMFLVAFSVPMLVYISNSQKESKSMDAYRQQVERELPNFVETFATQLSASRDIVRIMKDYSTTTSRVFQKELHITIADMETGSYEQALRHFSGRINSIILNDVIRGLNGVIRGNDEIAYFKMLSYDLKQMEINQMKKNAQKCIPKINACTMILLFGILALFTGVLIIDMMQGVGVLF